MIGEDADTSMPKRARSHDSTATLGDYYHTPVPIDSAVGSGNYKFVVLDIEGTTTPITFVKDILFPYARNNVKEYLEDTWDSSTTKACVHALHAQAKLDSTEGAPQVDILDINTVVENVKWNIEKDRKITPLKELQGHIWDKGYSQGRLQSEVYDDVPLFLARMAASSINVSIYSSGSRHAQKLLFKHTGHGDLRKFISCYFDTKIGNKREKSSYEEITLSLGADKAEDILFLTDIVEEAEAATSAGMQSIISIRPGNVEVLSTKFRTVSSFDQI